MYKTRLEAYKKNVQQAPRGQYTSIKYKETVTVHHQQVRRHRTFNHGEPSNKLGRNKSGRQGNKRYGYGRHRQGSTEMTSSYRRNHPIKIGEHLYLLSYSVLFVPRGTQDINKRAQLLSVCGPFGDGVQCEAALFHVLLHCSSPCFF